MRLLVECCELLLSSPCFFIRSAMKRISKTQLWRRFATSQTVRAEVLYLGPRRGRVSVEGVECILKYPASCRDELLGKRYIQARPTEVPVPLNNGFFPKGYRPQEGFEKCTTKVGLMPILEYTGEKAETESHILQKYAKANPAGSIVLAEVESTSQRHAKLKLVGGPRVTLDLGSCHDAFANEPIRRLPLPKEGDRVRVLIRRISSCGGHADVSLHTWRIDQGFCNQEAGYKNRFDVSRSHFAKLPWS